MKTEKTTTKTITLEERQKLIENFCYPEFIVWPRDMKCLSELIKTYGFDIIKSLNLGFKLRSMAWLKSKDGKALILKHQKQFLSLQPKQKVELDTSFEYTRTTTKKPASLTERLLQ